MLKAALEKSKFVRLENVVSIIQRAFRRYKRKKAQRMRRDEVVTLESLARDVAYTRESTSKELAEIRTMMQNLNEIHHHLLLDIVYELKYTHNS